MHTNFGQKPFIADIGRYCKRKQFHLRGSMLPEEIIDRISRSAYGLESAFTPHLHVPESLSEGDIKEHTIMVRNLSRLSMVSRAWSKYNRPKIFRTTAILSQRSATIFQNLVLSSACTLISPFKFINVLRVDSSASYPFILILLSKIPQYLKNVQSLHFEKPDDHFFPSAVNLIWPRILHRFSTLKYLKIQVGDSKIHWYSLLYNILSANSHLCDVTLLNTPATGNFAVRSIRQVKSCLSHLHIQFSSHSDCADNIDALVYALLLLFTVPCANIGRSPASTLFQCAAFTEENARGIADILLTWKMYCTQVQDLVPEANMRDQNKLDLLMQPLGTDKCQSSHCYGVT